MMLSIVINTVNRKEMLFDLLRCVFECDFSGISREITVVDDCSDELYADELHRLFPTVVFLRNLERSYLIKSRNIGWRSTTGDVVFFVDDDNEIFDKDIFKKGLSALASNDKAGIIGCRTYYYSDSDRINVGPVVFNMYTGLTKFPLHNQTDPKNEGYLVATHNCTNAFFVRRTHLEAVDGFTEEFFQTFSEADFAAKIRQIDLSVLECPELKVYHKAPVASSLVSLPARLTGGSAKRMYFLIRNRFLFISKHGSFAQRLIFGVLFAPVFTLYYLYTAIRNRQKAYAFACISGTRDGYIKLLYHDQQTKKFH
jgi:GT2 family glycosyltransferase